MIFWLNPCVSGVALAVILSGVRHISDTVFLEAAKVLQFSLNCRPTIDPLLLIYRYKNTTKHQEYFTFNLEKCM